MKLLVDIDQEHRGWDRRLEKKPKEFALKR